MELPDLNSKQPPRKHIYIFFKKKKSYAGMVQVWYRYSVITILTN